MIIGELANVLTASNLLDLPLSTRFALDPCSNANASPTFLPFFQRWSRDVLLKINMSQSFGLGLKSIKEHASPHSLFSAT